jgi:hypothetical protein
MSYDLSELGLDGFNAEEYESADYTALPAGVYPVIVTEAKWCQTKDQSGKYLKLTLEVIDGDHKNRKLWANINLVNKSAQAVDIAKRQFADICKAVGVLRPKNLGEIQNKPFAARVTVRDYNGDKHNEVKSFKPLGGAAESSGDDEAKKAPSSWMET